ncbi:MAG: efflux RND transporter periplasmic adaptor subunit [Bacteroidales bacterium]|nr:efflux RND transporter periplasmic adaptor subunit [Bacteroidales bacterium]MDD4656585.1 efflux RND transporter periplasmic adaptor subunit [Bacteroidales bacterium]
MKNKKLIWIIVIAVLLVIVLAWYGSTKEKAAITVTAQEITGKTIVEVIPANGKIKPVIEVKISPDVSGEIIELNFKEGDQINKGDLIIKIKQDVYISMKERAEASLNSVKAQLTQQLAQFEQTQQTYLRNKTLFEQKAISEVEYETAYSQFQVAKEQIKAAEFNVKSSEAALKEAQENLTKTVIYAPMDGIISKMSIEKGERVVGTSQMAGTEMLRIANFNQMEVLVDVNENDIIRISLGDTATIDVDAYPNRKFTGVVTQIANSAKNIGSALDQVTNFEVKIYILPDSYSDLAVDGKIPFRPGMSASVAVQTSRKEDINAIPLQAITTRVNLLEDSIKESLGINESIEQVFVIKEDNSTEVRKITTGIQDLNNIEVTSGLSRGELVVTGPFSAISKTLKAGDLVKIEEKNND